MKSAFNELKSSSSQDSIIVRIGIKPEYRELLETIAGLEGCSIGDIALEGIGRVFKDRNDAGMPVLLQSAADELRAGQPALGVIENFNADMKQILQSQT